MKKIIIVLLMAFVLFSFYSCNKKSTEQNEVVETKKEVSVIESKGIESILPASSIAVMKLRNLVLFYKDFVPALGLDKKDMSEVVKKLGFNPLNVKELNEFGFDHSREYGVVLNHFDIIDLTLKDPPVFDMSIFIPILDGKGIVKKIESIIQKKKKDFKFIEKDGYFVAPNKKKHPDVAFKVYKKYLFVSIYLNTDPKKTFDQLGKDPIINSPLYKKLLAKTENDPCFTLYGDFENTNALNKLIKVFKEKAAKNSKFKNSFGLEFYKGYKGFIMTADARKPDFTINAYGIISDDAPVMSLYKDVRYCKNTVLGIKENPLLYISFGINPGNYYEIMKKSFSVDQIKKFETGIKEFKVESGIDLIELINDLGGNFNYAMYDGKGINMASYNTVFSLSFKDEAKGKTVVDKLLKALKMKAGDKMTVKTENIMNVDTNVVMAPPAQFFIGIKNSALIFSTNKNYYEQALAGNIETGFTSKMDKKLADDFINGDVFYLSFDEGLKVFENFKPFAMMGLSKKIKPEKSSQWVDKITDIVNKFEYLMSSSKRLEKGLFEMSFIIKTRFEKSFTLGIIDLIKSFKKKEVLQKSI